MLASYLLFEFWTTFTPWRFLRPPGGLFCSTRLRMTFLRPGRFRRRFTALAGVDLLRFLYLAQDAQRRRRHPLHRKAEVLHDVRARCAQAVVIQPDDHALVAGPTLPAERRLRFHADALADCFRQYLFAVRRVLRREQLPARHTDHT